jgi:hypothetical protein
MMSGMNTTTDTTTAEVEELRQLIEEMAQEIANLRTKLDAIRTLAAS